MYQNCDEITEQTANRVTWGLDGIRSPTTRKKIKKSLWNGRRGVETRGSLVPCGLSETEAIAVSDVPLKEAATMTVLSQ